MSIPAASSEVRLIFLRKDEVLRLHDRSIDEFGGLAGVRDESGFESALIAAENRYHYEGLGVAACAATYLFHLVKAHAFLDGNKRVAVAAAEVFIEVNGGRLTASDDAYFELVLSVAAGELSRDDVEEWFARHVTGPAR
jgi:death-on-curing protein